MFPIHRFRLIVVALISFLFVANGVFLRRTTSIFLCGVLGFNSASCYGFLGNYGKVDAAVPPNSSVVVSSDDFSVSQKDEQKVAGCPFGVCIPKIPIPGGSVPGGDIVEKAKAEIIKQIGESLGVGSPLLLDQHTAYPDVSDQVRDFHPKQLTITSAEDLKKPLLPGDYSISVIAYCTQFSIHAPGQGLPYKLAPLQGKQAPAISALLSRGTLQGIAPATLNADAWRIQAGLPLKQWPSQDQDLIHKLIPEYEKGLQGDYLQRIEDTYNQYRAIPGIPSFNDLLREAGAPGQLVLQLRQARQVLSDKTVSAERLPDMLYEPTGDGLPRVLPAEKGASPSTWAEVQPGVFTRFTVIEGNLGKNLFEFRVTPKASAAMNNNSALVATKKLDKKVLVSEQTGTPPTPGSVVCDSNHITYSKDRPAQALIPACVSSQQQPTPSQASPQIIFEGKDITGKTQTVVVGQKIELTLSDDSSLQEQTWSIPGDRITGYCVHQPNFPNGLGYCPSDATRDMKDYEGRKIELRKEALKKSSIVFFWITSKQSVDVTCSYKLSNGQSGVVKTTFRVLGPVLSRVITKQGKVDIGLCSFKQDLQCLRFGHNVDEIKEYSIERIIEIINEKVTGHHYDIVTTNTPGIEFYGNLSFPPDFPFESFDASSLNWVQLVQSQVKVKPGTSDPKSFAGIDNFYPYPMPRQTGLTSSSTPMFFIYTNDTPQLGLKQFESQNEVELSQRLDFEMYLMWQPNKLHDSIPVPVGHISWYASGTANFDPSPLKDSSERWTLKDGSIGILKEYIESPEYPTWQSVIGNSVK